MNEYENIINEATKKQSVVRRKAAVRETGILIGKAAVVAMACLGLKTIGFISETFFLILEEAVLVGAAYKVGGIWHR